MNAIKILSLVILFTLIYGCSISDKDVEKFAKELTENFINKDSVSLYKKQMDGKTAGEWGFLIFLNNADFTFSNAKEFQQKIKTAKELVELSNQRYLESKNDELHLLSNLVYRFNNSLDSKIVSIKTDSLYILEENDIGNILNKQRKRYKIYNVRQILTTDKGDTIYFRPGFIMAFRNELYFDNQGLRFSDKKFD